MVWVYLVCFSLSIAKWLDVDWLQGVSWWWIAVPLIIAISWFEVLERELGFDRQRENQDSQYERAKQERIARGMGQRVGRGGRR